MKYKSPRTLTIVLFITIPLFLFSQNIDSSDYLVLKNNDTLFGNVEYYKEEGFGAWRFYKKIRVTNTKGKTKRYKRKKVKSFKKNGFLYESFLLRAKSRLFQKGALVNTIYNIDAQKGEQHFLKVISKGRLSHYEIEWFEDDSAGLWSSPLLRKQNDQFFIIPRAGLFGLNKKTLVNYFSGCSSLREAITQKKIKAVSEVVELYNNDCKK